jgi:hypothetical protein
MRSWMVAGWLGGLTGCATFGAAPGTAPPDAAADAGAFGVDGFGSALDCDGWVAAYATATPAPPGHESARSCKVCSNGGGFVEKRFTLSSPTAGSFHFDRGSRPRTRLRPRRGACS